MVIFEDDAICKTDSEIRLKDFFKKLNNVDFDNFFIDFAGGLDPNDVIAENVKKLEARYPGGSFDAFYSENRKDGDL
mgnify:CR=1 FL=1